MGLVGTLDALTERNKRFEELHRRLDAAHAKRLVERMAKAQAKANRKKKTDLTAKDESDIKPDPSPV
jgi:hypothetical protein